MSSRRRRNLLRTLAILVALVVVLAGAGAVYAYRYADRLVGKGQRPVANLTPAAGSLTSLPELRKVADVATGRPARRQGGVAGHHPVTVLNGSGAEVLTVGSGFKLG